MITIIHNYNEFRAYIQKTYRQEANSEIKILEESYHIKFHPNLTNLRIDSVCEDIPITFSCQLDYPFSSDLFKSWFTRFAEMSDEVWHECYDDPFDLLMNYTEPYMNLTEYDMEKIVSQAETDGWKLPPNITIKDMLAIYEDMNNEEK